MFSHSSLSGRGPKSPSRSLAAVLLAMLALSVAGHSQTAREPLPGTTVHIYRAVNGISLDLQVVEAAPDFPRPRPAIVFFFGGGWANGTQKQFLPFAEELARLGMVGILVDYRVSSRHKTTPHDAVDDAHAAMRWVKRNAVMLGIDPARVVAAGGSAGGHLALATTLIAPREQDTVSPAASLLIGYNPVADLRDPRWASRFGNDTGRISPVAHVGPALPDTLIFHGEADTTVPIAQVRGFCEGMTQAGNRCQVLAYEGATHGFFNFGRNDNRWYAQVLVETVAFLRQHGYVE
jgi:acetyl esterase/lipase